MSNHLDPIRQLIQRGSFVEALAEVDRISGEQTLSSRDLATCDVLRVQCLCGLGNWVEAAALGTRALQALRETPSPGMLGTLHGWLGTAHLRLGSIRKAESHYRAAVHIFTWDLDDLPGALKVQKRLGLMFHNLGRWSQARHEYESAIAAADESQIYRESAGVRINLAITSIKSGHLADVLRTLDQAESHASLSGADGTWPRLLVALVRGNLLRILGDVNSAMRILEASLLTCRAGRYARQETIALEYLGDCYLAKRDYSRAFEQYRAAMAIAEATAPKGDLVPELCHRIAECTVQLGDPNEAVLLCERGLRVARDLSDRYEECATYRVFAMAHKASGNPRKALRLADEGVELGRNYEIPYELARALTWAGEARLADGGLEEQALGRKQLWEARGHFARMGLRQWIDSIDRALGYEPALEPTVPDPALATLGELDALDRGALRFGLVTCSRAVSEAVATVQSIAPTAIPVLICGESGVGKELLARAVHQMSDRRKGPFVAIDCGALTTSLLESEMFGHERGAFTGAVQSREGLLVSADKGTLFLDEIGNLPPAAQASLLRVLESGEMRPLGKDDVRKVDVRVVAATNADLETEVQRGTFRQDLYYRLHGVRVTLPPLRDREEDIRALFRYYWAQACTTAKKTLRVSEEVESVLSAYDWPGNVRELRHEVARAVAVSPDGATVTAEQFLPDVRRKEVAALRRERSRRAAYDEERDVIIRALRAHRGNKAEAARSLGGMKRTTLIYKMQSLSIRPEEYEVQE